MIEPWMSNTRPTTTRITAATHNRSAMVLRYPVSADSDLGRRGRLTFDSPRSRTVSVVGAGFTIAEAARQSGFPPSTLRYYEEVGLLRPAGRTGSGYRVYDDESVARLSFIARAKQLGCSLEEIADLLVAWEGRECAPVQRQVGQLVVSKLAETRRRIADLVALTGELEAAAAGLAVHTPDGPCDDRCGCGATPSTPAIACSLKIEAMPERLRAWRAVQRRVVEQEEVAGGQRLVLAPEVDLPALVRLMADEQACCPYFRFHLTIDARGVALEITAPEEAAGLVAALAGART
jgi:DNA-binding transcriptional MerR regulator